MRRQGFEKLPARAILQLALACALVAPTHAQEVGDGFGAEGGLPGAEDAGETASSGTDPDSAPDDHSLPSTDGEPDAGGFSRGPAQSPGGRLMDAEFESAIESVFPMTPEMVRAFRQRLSENERANLESTEPTPIAATEMIALYPSSPPPRLLVAPGIATAVGFYDGTGAPWPVRQYVLGDGEAFQVVQLGDGANTLTISPLARVGWTNLVVALAEDPAPIVLGIRIGRARAHFRANIQVMRPGPNAAPTAAAPPDAPVLPKDSILLSMLAGAGPDAGAAEVPVRGIDASAWAVGGDIYIRSRHPLLSPSWSASISGPSGNRAYKMPPTSVLLFSVGGKIVAAELDLP